MPGVLVADDDAAFREQLVLLVGELWPGEHIEAVGDGHAAVARALTLRPHHVLLDSALPGTNGLNVATALTQALPATNVVIVTDRDGVGAADLPDSVRSVRRDGDLRAALVRAFAP